MKAGFYFIGFLVLVLLFVMFDYNVRKNYLTALKNKPNNQPVVLSEVVKAPKLKIEPINLSSISEKLNQFKFDPDQSDLMIGELAKNLSNDQILFLGEIIRNSSKLENHRTTALNLLAKNQSLQAFEVLSSFLQFQPGGISSEYERNLRTEALEQLATFPQKDKVLNQIQKIYDRNENQFLKYQAGRILEYMNPVDNNQPLLDQQDASIAR